LIVIVIYKNFKKIHCQDLDNHESKNIHNDSVDNTSSSNSSDKSFIPTITNSSVVSTSNIKKSVFKIFNLIKKKKSSEVERGCINKGISLGN
jgi:hypothetical protein